jgi:hypothetical protein
MGGGSMDTEPQPEELQQPEPGAPPQPPQPGPGAPSQSGPGAPSQSGPGAPQPGPGAPSQSGPLKLPGQPVQETIKPPSLLARELKDVLSQIYVDFTDIEHENEIVDFEQ